MPAMDKHVFVQGSLQSVDSNGCFLIIQDIILLNLQGQLR